MLKIEVFTGYDDLFPEYGSVCEILDVVRGMITLVIHFEILMKSNR